MSSLIQIPFVFQYPASGITKVLNLMPSDGMFPAKPIVEAMGLKWETQRVILNQENLLVGIQVAGMKGRPMAHITRSGIETLLTKLNPKRVSRPDLVLYFQSYFLQALDDYLKQFEPEEDPETEDLLPEFEVKELNDLELSAALAELPNVTYLGIPLAARDHARADLVRVGVRKFDEIDYIMRGFGIVLLKPNPKDPEGEPLRHSLTLHTYEQGKLQRAANNGFYPIPLFFRRFPNLYSCQTRYVRRIERGESGIILDAGRSAAPLAQAPWYTREFETEILNLKLVLQKVRDKDLREKMLAAVLNGDFNLEDLNDDNDMENAA